jgi:ubiquinone/menaquinone biosynthesis C-methylase UbiE
MKKSETQSARPYLERFCQGDVLDIGHGGDPIVDSAIIVDRHHFPEFGDDQIVCDALTALPFENEMFQTVYSSHLLEDAVNTEAVLKEWIRVLKPDGNLILFLPNQMAYEEHCKANNTQPNQDHKHKHFCFEYVVACLPACMNVIHFENPVTYNPYSFAIVARKIAGMPTHTLHDMIRAEQQKRQQEIDQDAKEQAIRNDIAAATNPIRVWTPDDIP